MAKKKKRTVKDRSEGKRNADLKRLKTKVDRTLRRMKALTREIELGLDRDS